MALAGIVALEVGLRVVSGQAKRTEATATPVPSRSEVKATHGTERFTFKGLRTGDGPDKIRKFVEANGLRMTDDSSSYFISGDGIKRIDYRDEATYSSASARADAPKIMLRLTPPFPTPDGVGSAVWGISGDVPYGEGLTEAEVKADLQRRWGPATTINEGILEWVVGTRKKGAMTPPFSATAEIVPSSTVGSPGAVRFDVRDFDFHHRAERAAILHLEQTESQRQKDRSGPDF